MSSATRAETEGAPFLRGELVPASAEQWRQLASCRARLKALRDRLTEVLIFDYDEAARLRAEVGAAAADQCPELSDLAQALVQTPPALPRDYTMPSPVFVRFSPDEWEGSPIGSIFQGSCFTEEGSSVRDLIRISTIGCDRVVVIDPGFVRPDNSRIKEARSSLMDICSSNRVKMVQIYSTYGFEETEYENVISNLYIESKFWPKSLKIEFFIMKHSGELHDRLIGCSRLANENTAWRVMAVGTGMCAIIEFSGPPRPTLLARISGRRFEEEINRVHSRWQAANRPTMSHKKKRAFFLKYEDGILNSSASYI